MEEEEIKRLVNQVQTSLYDQVNALKSEVQKAKGDVDATLEISATIEKTINPLNYKKLKYAVDINHISWQLSMTKLGNLLFSNKDPEKFHYHLQQLIDFASFDNKTYLKINEATTDKELESVWQEYFDEINNLLNS